jgi:hypothetical protein
VNTYPSLKPPNRSAVASSPLAHGIVVLIFGVIAIAWTWPLILHLGDALPGDPGDNYIFVWNLWWMRRVLSTPELGYFHTTYLFYPFGTTIVDHPNTALPALVAATLLRRVSPVTAQNILLLVYIFANLASMYVLAWDLTRDHMASIVAALVFGVSPYVAVHLLGHFDLVAVWPLPIYALLLRRALARHSNSAMIGAGAIMAMTAYIAYYYVVYLAAFTIVYAAAASQIVATSRSHMPPSKTVRRLRVACAVTAVVCATVACVIAVSGGGTLVAAGLRISARTPQNALTAMWLALAVWAVAAWRPRVHPHVTSSASIHAVRVVSCIVAVFLLLASPLLWQAARLTLRHEYVTPQYFWRNIPPGIDLIAPLLGHPLHPLFGQASARAYSAFGQIYIEAIGWLGVVPIVLLVATRANSSSRGEAPAWWSVGIAFAIWALGPFLTVGGFDTGLKLPGILLRYIPLVANARMPGRAVVIVYMAMAVLIALGLASARGRLRSPLVRWLPVAVILFEYWIAPIRLTALDHPAVYGILAKAEPGAVCEVPFGIGDGLGGVGPQDRRVLFYAIEHGHPLVGGFIGRMPNDAASRYAGMPVVGTLLRLSNGESRPPGAANDVDTATAPCRYLVVHRSASSGPLLDYVRSLRPALVAASGDDELYRLR